MLSTEDRSLYESGTTNAAGGLFPVHRCDTGQGARWDGRMGAP